jgi:hypothetical protein
MTTEEHYKILFERADREKDFFRGLLFDSWRTMAGQTRGLQRQRRLIKRLQAQIKRAVVQQSTAPASPPPAAEVKHGQTHDRN